MSLRSQWNPCVFLFLLHHFLRTVDFYLDSPALLSIQERGTKVRLRGTAYYFTKQKQSYFQLNLEPKKKAKQTDLCFCLFVCFCFKRGIQNTVSLGFWFFYNDFASRAADTVVNLFRIGHLYIILFYLNVMKLFWTKFSEKRVPFNVVIVSILKWYLKIYLSMTLWFAYQIWTHKINTNHIVHKLFRNK